MTGSGTGFGTYADRALAGLALALRGLDLPSFIREVARCVCEGLGVEHCKVFRCLSDGRRTPLRVGGRTVLSRGVGLRGGIGVVVRVHGRAFGVLVAYSASRRCYTEREARFLRDVAELLGAAVERAYSAEAYRRAIGKERRRAEVAEERYAFIHEANAVLAAAPDGPAAAARLVVPILADSCFVDLVEEDGTARGLIRRHLVVRTGRAGDRELTLRYPLDTDAPHGTPKVLRTGQPELIPDLPDGLLRSLAADREHLELMRSLGPGSYLCVPLQAGLRLIGSIGFVSSRAERGRRYGPEDLTLARCLARCTALAATSSPGISPGRPRASGDGTARLLRGVGSAVLDAKPALTPRQLEVLGLLDRGMRVHQIKVELGLSEPTVRTHVRAILRAFGACSQLEALHRARAFGLVAGLPGDGERS